MNATYQYGHPGMYGSSDGGAFISTQTEKRPHLRIPRHRFNIVAILISIFLPWVLFCSMYWTMSFHLHFHNPFLCYFLVLLGLCVVSITGLLAFDAIRKKNDAARFIVRGDYYEPTWLIFLFGTCLLAWLVGVMGGDLNYFNHMEFYYDVSNLNVYADVDVSRQHGQQLMDAGRVIFASGTKLDLARSMGFKNDEMYCVAPIMGGNDPKHIPSYDFWAVGVNCCSGNRADFRCGEFNNVRANSGLRLMRDDQRAFFRLAVQQAEAAYNIRAEHPLFFHWMHDSIAEVNSYWEEGLKYYLIGIFTHFIVQLFLVVVACIAFSKLKSSA